MLQEQTSGGERAPHFFLMEQNKNEKEAKYAEKNELEPEKKLVPEFVSPEVLYSTLVMT